MAAMDTPKPLGQESSPKAKLSDEQKAYVRQEMAKCRTPQDAQKRREELVEELKDFGVTLPQIRAISAYKVNPDGSLLLKKQFPKSLAHDQRTKPEPQTTTEQSIEVSSLEKEVTPQIEALYDNPTKKAWRAKIREVVKSDFDEKRLRSARVICLPGQALQEVVEVYLPLGIQPQNIVCIERDRKVADKMRAIAKRLNCPVTIFEGTAEDFLRSEHDPVTIASFDFLGPLHTSFLQSLRHLRKADRFMIITNFLQRREKKTEQVVLGVHTSSWRTAREKFLESRAVEHNELFSKDFLGKSFEENVHDVVSGKKPIDLSDARDEGMIGALEFYLEPDLYVRPLDSIYAEVGATTPSLGTMDHQEFIQQRAGDVETIVKSAFEKYPELSKKLAQTRSIYEKGFLPANLLPERRSFAESFTLTMILCLLRVMTDDVRLYKYTSESSGSPYQTDILLQHDMGPTLRQEHHSAYEFIREFIRVLGQNDSDKVSIRLEKLGKTLPQNYAGAAVAIALSLRVNGSTRARTSLHSLTRLVDHWEYLVSVQMKTNPREDQKPREEIKVS